MLKEDNRIKVLFESKEVFELMIEHVNEKDQGIYKCVAVNSEGKDETSGRITVTSQLTNGLTNFIYSKFKTN